MEVDMHEVFKFDDQSVRKNEWHIRLARKGVRTLFAVFREDRPMRCSERTQLQFNGAKPKQWLGFDAYPLLAQMQDSGLGIDKAEFWMKTVPGLARVNTDLFPLHGVERLRFYRKLISETDQADADLLFCDLGTGLATIPTMNRRATIRSQVHLYWDELCTLYDSTSASLAIYQHGRRQSWPVVLDDYRAALNRRRFEALQLKSGRARIVLLMKEPHMGRLKKACNDIASQDRRFRVLDGMERAIHQD
jgi:hypothetical protein